MRGAAWLAAFAVSFALHAAFALTFRPSSVGETRQAAGKPVAVAGSLAGILGSAHSAPAEPPAQPAKSPPAEIVEATRSQPLDRTRAVKPVPLRTVPLTARAVTARPVAPLQPLETKAVEQATLADPVQAVPAEPENVREARPATDKAREVVTREKLKPVKPNRVRPKETQPRKRRQNSARPASSSPIGTKTKGSAGVSAGSRGRRTASAGAIARYGARVRRRIVENRPGAKGSGRAVVTFAVTGNGRLRFVRLVRSSGSTRLDRLAVRAVRRSLPFPRPPAGASLHQLQFTIGFRFDG